MKKAKQQPWYLYLVRCSDGSLYTGITKDVKARIVQHNAKRGAKYTRSKLPVVLVLKHRFKNHRLAAQAEARIKQLKKREREKLVATGWSSIR